MRIDDIFYEIFKIKDWGEIPDSISFYFSIQEGFLKPFSDENLNT